ncbi:MAG: nucleotidyltransferase domain-containing protein [Ruminococcus flavefaciens]|nr:nucleotidyltransferase domain-containing protein [Ruminococcus flavefaciens]MCM1229876.1 nucleotidyltransferase domain-containing protein [Ruminococcus flavefaciens]
MRLDEIKMAVAGAEYDFLRTNSHLGKNIILLGLGGSHAYGTENENSDLDIRGCALNSREELLCGENFEQVTDVPTDTTIYSFMKLIRLLTSCNPNTIEILGLKPEHYIYLSEQGREMLDNRHMFLSRMAVKSFGGYATAQFHRLSNKSEGIALGKRNKNAILHNKIGKHMMHLVRLYLMCIDILEKGEIITYREAEHDLLMSIRNGGFLDSESQPTDDFFALVDDYKKRLEYAGENTDLPEKPDYRQIRDFVISVNERIVTEKI